MSDHDNQALSALVPTGVKAVAVKSATLINRGLALANSLQVPNALPISKAGKEQLQDARPFRDRPGQGRLRFSSTSPAVRERCDAAAVHFKLGLKLLYQEWDLSAAIREFRAAIRLSPDYAVAHLALGNVLNEQVGRHDAIQEYRAAIELQPDYGEAHLALGKALAEDGDVVGAISELRSAVRLQPENGEAHKELARALETIAEWYETKGIESKEDFEEAEAEWGKAAVANCHSRIRLQPDDAEAHFSLGLALRDKDDWEGAEEAFRTTIRLQPAHAGAHYNLSFVLDLKDDPGGHFNRGLALKGKVDIDGAIAEFREAIRLRPGHAHHHYRLALALVGTAAEDEFNKAFELDPWIRQFVIELPAKTRPVRTDMPQQPPSQPKVREDMVQKMLEWLRQKDEERDGKQLQF